MLGRLLRKGSSSSLYANNQPSSNQEIPNNAGLAPGNGVVNNGNSFEDGYTRETLYGTSDSRSLVPVQFDRTAFRVIVSQDGGNLRSKQVLYDSAYNGTPIARNQKSKLHHHAAELHDYIFGCGIPANESHFSSKLHILPSPHNKFNDTQYSVLVSKLFSLTDLADEDTYSTPSWRPQLALDTDKANNLHASLPSFDYKPTSKSHNLIHSRFAVAFIIPIESLDNLTTVVLNNWEEICHFLIILQRLVSKKLVTLLNNAVRDEVSDCDASPYITNKRIQFPDLVLQQDSDVALQIKKLVRLVHYNTNVPRLASTNLLIRFSAASGSTSFHPIIINWAIELTNWLEFKDGKNIQLTNALSSNTQFLHNDDVMMSSTFLASLFATVLPFRKLLGMKPLEKGPDRHHRDVTRVVIMTGNPVVAKKLVFILNGLIPDNRISVELSHCKDVSALKDTAEPCVREHHNEPLRAPRNYYLSPSPTEEVVSSSFGSTPTKNKVQAMPIPIKSAPISTANSSDNSAHSLSRSATSRGWEIPHKSCASTSTTPLKSKVDTTTNTIPIKATKGTGNNLESRRSLSRSTSMAYLSSSLSSTLSSSASNYSLSKLGGSFLDMWKGAQPGHMGSYFDHHPPEFEPHITGGSLSKRNSVQYMRTPSPAVEHDEFNWHPQPPNRSNRKPANIDTKHVENGYELIRSTTGIYPTYKVRGKTLLHNIPQMINEARIRAKCSKIMNSKLLVSSYSSNTLSISDGDEDDSLGGDDQSTITSLSDVSDRIAHSVPLLPVAAFSDEFWPEFVLQSCPLSPKLESQITTAMKNDLLFFKNSCGYNDVSSRTILVSLRAKEIKLFEMKTVPGDEGGDNTATAYKSSVRRVFTPQKNHGDKELIAKVEARFDRVTQCLQAYMSKKDSDPQDLIQVVLLLIDI